MYLIKVLFRFASQTRCLTVKRFLVSSLVNQVSMINIKHFSPRIASHFAQGLLSRRKTRAHGKIDSREVTRDTRISLALQSQRKLRDQSQKNFSSY